MSLFIILVTFPLIIQFSTFLHNFEDNGFTVIFEASSGRSASTEPLISYAVGLPKGLFITALLQFPEGVRDREVDGELNLQR